MATNNSYGPLAPLIGSWQSELGNDVSPEPDGVEENAYRETLIFEPAGDISNAEKQNLWVVRYHQLIHRIRDNKHLHDQVGYWSWDPQSQTVMQSLTIPRGVCILAGGTAHSTNSRDTLLNVSASLNDPDWSIVQSPFMAAEAKTTEYQHNLRVSDGILHYSQSMFLEIYGKTFDHTDENTLTRLD